MQNKVLEWILTISILIYVLSNIDWWQFIKPNPIWLA